MSAGKYLWLSQGRALPSSPDSPKQHHHACLCDKPVKSDYLSHLASSQLEEVEHPAKDPPNMRLLAKTSRGHSPCFLLRSLRLQRCPRTPTNGILEPHQTQSWFLQRRAPELPLQPSRLGPRDLRHLGKGIFYPKAQAPSFRPA